MGGEYSPTTLWAQIAVVELLGYQFETILLRSHNPGPQLDNEGGLPSFSTYLEPRLLNERVR